MKIQVTIPPGDALDAMVAMAQENGVSLDAVVAGLAMRRAMMRVHAEWKREAGKQVRAALVSLRSAKSAAETEQAMKDLAAARVVATKTRATIHKSRANVDDTKLKVRPGSPP